MNWYMIFTDLEVFRNVILHDFTMLPIRLMLAKPC